MVDHYAKGLTKKENFYISVLAHSASIFLTAYDPSSGKPGILFQLDHLNARSGMKEFRILKCLRFSESSYKNCTSVYTQSVSNIISSCSILAHVII